MVARRFPVGAEVQEDGAVHFRVWAPASKTVSVELYSSHDTVERIAPLQAEPDGYFSANVKNVADGALYKFKLESGSFPDPVSRFQPKGPHGPSQVVDPRKFKWTDKAWTGLPVKDLVIYELHLGTFTKEGTWRAAMRELKELRRLGVTMLEIMPVADFCGEFGWGYDGVDIFAPTRLYGTPDDARAFVDHAHSVGLMVILDVVYNHLGPDGNFLRQYSPSYFSTKYHSEWGEAFHFEGAEAGPVREFFTTNARYWIEEFHFDGLRLDATQQIWDESDIHILQDVTSAAKTAGNGRTIYVVAENEPQETRLVRSTSAGGFGMDAVWNDDFHHSAAVAATGMRDAYYTNYLGNAQEFVAALKFGFLYQGQWYPWQKQRRGHPSLNVSPLSFVQFLDNHDQVANSLRGERIHRRTSPGLYKVLSAVLLLARATPMLFQGQEFAASSPFLYFADHKPELDKLVTEGRHKFLRQFRSIASAEHEQRLAQPGDRNTFECCKLDFEDRKRHAGLYRFHEDLLRIRRTDTTLASPTAYDGAVLGERAFVMRYFGKTPNEDRLLVVNLERDLHISIPSEPLLAPPENMGWTIVWSSESPEYGGYGTPDLETTAGWLLPGHAAVLLKPDKDAKVSPTKLAEKD
ncbi:MAG: malto-oligosyltrehalose trehalohydrolase [Nibricoccus sp.]